MLMRMVDLMKIRGITALVRLVNSAVIPDLHQIDHAHQHRQGISRATGLFEAGNRIEHDDLGLEVVHQLEHGAEVDLEPEVVVLNPVSSFEQAGGATDALAMLMRMVDLMKIRGITALFTSLTSAEQAAEQSEIEISSLIDTWLIVRNLEQAGERIRTLSVIKSRGMKHSNQARELL